MAKKKGNLYGKVIEYTRTENGTSIGRRPKFSSMNKNKKKSFKKYRGQGKWKDQTSILMVSLYLIKCHKILDHHKVEVLVETAECFLKEECFVVYLGLRESKILMFATNGDQDISEDNGTNNTKWWCLYFGSSYKRHDRPS